MNELAAKGIHISIKEQLVSFMKNMDAKNLSENEQNLLKTLETEGKQVPESANIEVPE